MDRRLAGSAEPLAGIVLAGGSSRRMGRDKATLPHPRSHPAGSPRAGSPRAGTTMVEHTVAMLARRCDPVFVIAAPGQSLPPLPGVTVLRDEVRGIGPLLAAGRGLRAAAEAGVERAFVCAVDMPELSVAVIDDLAACRGVDVVLPWDGRDHYLAGVYRTDLAGRIDALVAAGRRSMRSLTDSALTWRVVMADTGELANLNTPADVRAASAETS